MFGNIWKKTQPNTLSGYSTKEVPAEEDLALCVAVLPLPNTQCLLKVKDTRKGTFGNGTLVKNQDVAES